jgi:hypothetical protein
MAVINPIKKVNGAAIACPSTYVYNLQDISAADSGRTEDTNMHKNRIGQCVSLELSWQNIPTATVSAILQAFNPEYITVQYLDAKSGSFKTSVFYVGDRSAPMYNAKLGLWSNVSFNIIERSGV